MNVAVLVFITGASDNSGLLRVNAMVYGVGQGSGSISIDVPLDETPENIHALLANAARDYYNTNFPPAVFGLTDVVRIVNPLASLMVR